MVLSYAAFTLSGVVSSALGRIPYFSCRWECGLVVLWDPEPAKVSGAAQALSASAAMIANKPAAEEVGFSFKAISFEKQTGTAGVPAQWLVRTYPANPVCAIDPVPRITV